MCPPSSAASADELVLEEERAAGAALLGRPLAHGKERAVRDADGREFEHRPELKGEAGPAQMIAAGRVDEKHIRQLRQRTNSGFQESPLAQCEQARLVRREPRQPRLLLDQLLARVRPGRHGRILVPRMR